MISRPCGSIWNAGKQEGKAGKAERDAFVFLIPLFNMVNLGSTTYSLKNAIKILKNDDSGRI
jgi:hypothetical protein